MVRKFCGKCKRTVVEAIFGNWKVSACNCTHIVVNFKNKAIFKYENSSDVITPPWKRGLVLKILKLKGILNNQRKIFNEFEKHFPVMREEGKKVFHEVE